MGVTYLKRRAKSSEASQSVEQIDGQLVFAKNIYERLSNITENRNLERPEEASNQYEKWLLDMNNLHNKKYYPELAADDPEPTAEIVEFDRYLGSLGVTEEYPFKDSTYSSDWLDIDTQTEYRVLTDSTDNSYLVDGSGNEILIKYI